MSCKLILIGRDSRIVRKWWKLLVSFLCKEKELAFHLVQKIQEFCGELDFMKKALRVGGKEILKLSGALFFLQRFELSN